MTKDKSSHPVTDFLRSVSQRGRVENFLQVKRMIGGIKNMFVSMQCSECQCGEKFKQTRVNGGSIYDSLKVINSDVKVLGISNKRG